MLAITSAIGVGRVGRTPIAIVITGTAEGCADDTVQLMVVGDGVAEIELSADVGEDGCWLAVWKDAGRLGEAGLTCLGPVTVKARCEGATVSEARLEGRLELPGVTPPTPPIPPTPPTWDANAVAT